MFAFILTFFNIKIFFEVSKFRTLLKMAAGEGGIPELIREPIQKLTTASLAELFRNVLPGYPIHVLSETEKSQKMRKETKRLEFNYIF